MTDSLDLFYSCLDKTIVEEILKKDGEYLVRTSRQDAEINRLTAALGENMASRVDNLLADQLAIGELREAAYFRAGFRLALELAW